MKTNKKEKEIVVHHVPMDSDTKEFDDEVYGFLNSSIKNKMKNEVPEDYEVRDHMYEIEKVFNFSFKSIAYSLIALVAVSAIFFMGLSFRTPITKVDQDLISTTDSLRGLEKVRSEYASGVTSKQSQITSLEKDVEVLEGKIVDTQFKIGETKTKIESIIKAKVSSK